MDYDCLNMIDGLLPSGNTPTLITDAGDLHPWFKKVIILMGTVLALDCLVCSDHLKNRIETVNVDGFPVLLLGSRNF